MKRMKLAKEKERQQEVVVVDELLPHGPRPEFPLRDMILHASLFITPFSKKAWRKVYLVRHHVERSTEKRFNMARAEKVRDGKMVKGIRIQRVQ